MNKSELFEKSKSYLPESIETLKNLVETNSWTKNQDGVLKIAKQCENFFETLNFETKISVLKDKDKNQIHHFTSQNDFRKEKPTIFFIAHLDTVFHLEKGFTDFEFDPKSGIAKGPGVADIKGGIVVIFGILNLLEEIRLAQKFNILVFFSGDEEIGSPTGKIILNETVKKHKPNLAFVFEAGRNEPYGGLVTARKGVAHYYLKVFGKDSHSGNAFEKGISAVNEIAQKILRISDLTDLENGITFNFGLLKSINTANTISNFAEAEIDGRFWNEELFLQKEKQIREICDKSFTQNLKLGIETRTELFGEITMPSMPETEERNLLAKKFIKIGKDFGFQIGEAKSGGGSDACNCAKLGILTIDGLGVVGGNLHTENEWADLNSIPERIALVVEFLKNFWKEITKV